MSGMNVEAQRGARWTEGPAAGSNSADAVSSYGRLLWACLILTAFNVPFESATSIPVVGSVPRLIGGVTILVFVASLAQRRRWFTVPRFARLFLVYILYACLTLAWVTPEADSRVRAALLIQLAVFGALVVQLARTRRERAMLATAYGLGSVVASLIVVANKLQHIAYLDQELALGQVVTRSNVGLVARYSIGIEDPNYIGMVLVLGVPMLLWGLSNLRGRRGLRLGLALAPVILYAALLTGSRGSTVVAPAGVALYVIVSRGRRHFGRMLVGLALAMIVGLVVWRALPADTQYRVRTGFDSSQSTSKTREEVWRAGYHAFLKRPIQGYGLGSYRFVVSKELTVGFVAHNTFINVSVELGLIGAFLLLGIVIGVWRRSLRLPDAERLYIRVTLLLFAGSSSFISADLKKVSFFVLALLVAHVTNHDEATTSGADRITRTPARVFRPALNGT